MELDPKNAAGAERVVAQPMVAPLTRGGASQYGSRAFLRNGDWVGGVGPAFWGATAGEATSVPGDSRGRAACGVDAGRCAVPHPGEAYGSVLRTDGTDHGANRRRCGGGGRSAWLPLFRRARSSRFRGWDGESQRPSGE